VLLLHIIQFSRNQVPQQEHGLHLVEVPSLLTALNNTTNESYLWTDASIVLTRTQGPPNKWKISVGNRVAIIHEESSSAICRNVPSQSNPADLTSRGTEPSTLPTSTPWRKGPHRSSQELSSWPTTEVTTTTDNLEIINVHVPLLQPLEVTTQGFSKLNNSSVTALQKIHQQLQTSQGQQANNHFVHPRS